MASRRRARLVTPADGPEVVVLADHPSLHRGFATVARAIARHLYETTAWSVRAVGYYPPDPGWRSPGYAVESLDAVDRPRSERIPSLVRRLERGAWGQRPQVLLCIGTLFDLASAVEAVERAGIRRRIRMVGYTPIDSAPIPVQVLEVLRGFDRVVPYTRFAAEAIADAAARAGVPAGFVGPPIPLGVDTACFRPIAGEERRRLRRDRFGLAGAEPLLGYFGRNSGNKRVDEVLRLFHLVASGRYATCRRCGNTGACALDRDGRPAALPSSCPACGSQALQPGRPREDVVLYLHTDADAHRVAPASGGRDLLRIAEAYGVRGRVRFRADLRIGRGDDPPELARRMAACDVHVAPFERGAWELTVLETGACGVANLITEVAAPPEYAAPFSRVVPVGSWVLDTELGGLVDTDLALRSLLGLLDDPLARRALAREGPRVARLHDWRVVGSRWVEVLGRCLDAA